MSPDKIYGPQLAEIFKKYCECISKESGASGVRVMVEFVSRKGKGELGMKTYVTADSKTERLLDLETAMPRGAKLQHEATVRVAQAFDRLSGDKGRRL